MLNFQDTKPTFQIDIAQELKNSLVSKSPIDLGGIDPISVQSLYVIEHHFGFGYNQDVFNKNIKKENQSNRLRCIGCF